MALMAASPWAWLSSSLIDLKKLASPMTVTPGCCFWAQSMVRGLVAEPRDHRVLVGAPAQSRDGVLRVLSSMAMLSR
jgi:hypothetical protein